MRWKIEGVSLWSQTEFDCLVVGDVMFDILFGNLTTFPFLKGGTSYCDFAKIDLGGAGNVAVALSHLGGKTCFIGKAGDDCWGKLYKEDLIVKGVTTRMFFEQGCSTGLTLVALGKKAQRSFHVFRGANNKLSIDEINRSLKLLKNSECLYFSGYSLVASPQKDAVLHAVNFAKKNHLHVIFDPGAPNLIRSNFRLFNDLLDICDVFLPNLDEAKAMTKTDNLKTAILELQQRGKFTALKCGASGCFLIGRKNNTKTPAFKVCCQDTTGAGDSFAAALVFGLINHFPIKSIGQLANWLAAQLVTHIGARSFPPKKEISNFLARTGLTVGTKEEKNAC